MKHSRLKKLISRMLLLALAVVMLSASVLDVAAASPKSTKSVSATLAYTLKGLPLGRAVQNFYIGSTYIYCTQRVDGTTYLNRLKIEGKTAVYKDRMTFKNCGHGQSLDCYSYNGENYFYIGVKADDSTDYYWSVQIARVKYEAGKTYDYTDLNRFTYMNYASKSSSRLGDTYRVACGGNSKYTIFRIQTKNSSRVTWSIYDTAKLNKLLDKSKTVRMDTSAARAACLYSFSSSVSSAIRPNDSFQGIDLSTYSKLYTSGGADGQTPQIAKFNQNGTYLKLLKISNVGKKEIEGVQCKDSKVYFVIVTGTTAAAKKNEQKIYYVNESAFN